VLVLLSTNKANAGFNPAQLRDVLMGTSNGDSDRPPLLPARLKPPAPPAIEKIHTEATETMPTSAAVLTPKRRKHHPILRRRTQRRLRAKTTDLAMPMSFK
jgi:hypothetical protein